MTAPWGIFVRDHLKKWETRGWTTSHRGDIAIHSSKAFPGWAKDLCFGDPHFVKALAPYGITTRRDLAAKLPLGAIVAVAYLELILPTEEARDRLVPRERAFGDYSDHRFAWRLDGVRALPAPIPCQGALGLWTVPAEIVTRIDDQLGKVA